MSVHHLPPICSQSPTTKYSKSPLDSSSPSSVLASSLHSVRYAGGRGIRLAQQSRASLHRLLDSVIDNATALTEARHLHSPDRASPRLHTRPHRSMLPAATHLTPTNQSDRPTMASRRRSIAKAKFFVCEEDSDEDDYDDDDDDDDRLNDAEAVRTDRPIARLNQAITGNYSTSQSDDSSSSDDRDNFYQRPLYGTPTRHQALKMSTSGLARRHSLLSDLFLAEKLSAAKSPTIAGGAASTSKRGPPSTMTTTTTTSTLSSCCPSTGNSDEELSYADPTVQQTVHRPSVLTRQQAQEVRTVWPNQRRIVDRSYTLHHSDDDNDHDIRAISTIAHNSAVSKAQLQRTKRSVFKRLDGLAVDPALLAGTVTAPASSISSSSSSSAKTPLAAPINTVTSPANHCILAPVSTLSHSSALSLQSSESTPLRKKNSDDSSQFRNRRHHLQQQQRRSTPPSTVSSTNRCSPTTATTTTAFATASVTSKSLTSLSSSSAATAVAAAAAAAAAANVNININTAGGGRGLEMFPGWSRVQHMRVQIHTICDQFNSSVQRAMSTVAAL
ncbi:hypothetical protein BGZ98_007197 [Dissophora globulifera]|nr:hypothetical protein BGZ98_007197 [Dissophora globulifera]